MCLHIWNSLVYVIWTIFPKHIFRIYDIGRANPPFWSMQAKSSPEAAVGEEETPVVQHLEDSQVDTHWPCGFPPSEEVAEQEEVKDTHMSSVEPEKPKTVVEVLDDENTEKPKERKRQKKSLPRNDVIPNPPALPSEIVEASKTEVEKVKETKSDEVEVGLEAQRALKRELEEREKLAALEKKECAAQKKQDAAELAVKRAEQKLEKAKAKALAVQKKQFEQGSKGVKRNLDKQFEQVDDKTPKEAASPAHAKAKARAKAKISPNQKKKVSLSPKAKAFAASTAAKPDKPDPRQKRATDALETLRFLELPDLPLPKDGFNKKTLACSKLIIIYQQLCGSKYFWDISYG